jgi:two-component system C4-dicarboxylate transport response regulator DctD
MFDGLKVLLVEDDPAVRFGAAQALSLAGLDVETFESADAARAGIHPHLPGVLVTDVRMRGMSGLELLEHALGVDPDLPVIIITGHGDIAMAVQAMRRGAYDFMEKPFASEQLIGVVQRALEKRKLVFEVQDLRRRLEDRQGIESVLIGRSAQVEELRRTILALGEAAPDVLIRGETGTGKELVAQCLHQFSSRHNRRFIALNCGALPETMIESEVFGHEAGAFTAAGAAAAPPAANGLAEQVDEFEKSVIVEQLRREQGNVATASEALGVPKKTLYDKIKKHEISLEWFR